VRQVFKVAGCSNFIDFNNIDCFSFSFCEMVGCMLVGQWFVKIDVSLGTLGAVFTGRDVRLIWLFLY
jgi:hypothetical protein